MVRCILRVLLYTGFLIGCRSDSTDTVTISGTISDSSKMEGRTLYLFDAANKGDAIDSTVIKNRKYHFTLQADTGFAPFRVRLMYWDTLRNASLLKQLGQKDHITYLRPLGFRNPFIRNYIESSFYVDRGNTAVRPDSSRRELFVIDGSKQNIPYFKKVSFATTHDSDLVKRKEVIEYNKAVISQYGYSYFLYSQLYKLRENFRTDELAELLDLFKGIKDTRMDFAKYITIQNTGTSTEEIISKIYLEGIDGDTSLLLNNKGDMKILVFWASWCGPCRKEIPRLKEMYATYKNKGISMISVSVDGSSKSWKNALVQEKMPWRQLIVNEMSKPAIDAVFNVQAIPLIFLFDRNDKMIGRFTSLEDSAYRRLEKLIMATL